MIAITLSNSLVYHLPEIDGIPDFNSFTTDPDLKAALQDAYEKNNWEYYTEPEIIQIAVPNPSGFRVALASCTSWVNWATSLPSVHYTNLVIAASQDNWTLAQTFYNNLIQSYSPEETSRVEWQAIADSYNVPIKFQSESD